LDEQGSIRNTHVGWVARDGMAAIIKVKNGGKAQVKPKSQLGRAVLFLNG